MGELDVGTDPVGDLMGAEQTCRFGDGALTMRPPGLKGLSHGLLTGK
jgi:hypothetical protein